MGKLIVFLIHCLLVCFVWSKVHAAEVPFNNSESILVVPFNLKNQGFLRYQELYQVQPDQIILTNSSKPPSEGTGDIVKFLREQKGSATLVCFHRAAAECLDSLLLYPELQKSVGRFISLEGKVKGDETSEGIARFQLKDIERAKKLSLGSGIRLIFKKIKDWIFPYPEGVYAMNPQRRDSYLRKKQKEILRLSSKVRLISIDPSSKKYGVVPYSQVIDLSHFEKNAIH